jgi:TRAP transporter TAXI family solute receptor
MNCFALTLRLAAAALVASLACGIALAQQPPVPAKPATDRSVQIGGAAVGQFGHFVAVGWGRTIAKLPGYHATPVASSGMIENAQLIAQKKMEFGWVSGLIVDDAKRGDTSVITKEELAQLRGAFTLPAGAHHVVVLASSPIRRLEDLAGKRISGFGRGSLGWPYVNEVLGAVGIPKGRYREEPLGPSQAVQALKDGKVDAVWGTGNPPNPWVVELGATTRFRLIPIPPAVLAKLEAKSPSWQSAVIPKGVYANVEGDADVPTIQQTQIAATSTNVDADTVYAATYAVMEDLTDFWAAHPGAKFLQLKTALDGMSLPLHVGALRYYRAKGIDVPARLIPAEAR